MRRVLPDWTFYCVPPDLPPMSSNYSPLVDCDLVDAGENVSGTVARACYGHTLAFLAPELEEHLWGSVSLVPEGVLIRSTCGRCGAHSEQVLALPELPTLGAETPEDFVRPDEELVEYLAETVEPAMEDRARNWYPDHRSDDGCAATVRLPEPLIDLQELCLERARKRIEAGRLLGAHVYLHFGDGTTAAVPFTEVLDRDGPEDRVERSRRIERVKAVGRQHVARRSEQSELIGAVLLSEAWVVSTDDPRGLDAPPRRNPARAEGIICQVFTREGGRSQVAPFRRTVGDGGEVGDWRRQAVAWGRFTEGVIAPVRTVWRDKAKGWSSLGVRTGGAGVH